MGVVFYEITYHCKKGMEKKHEKVITDFVKDGHKHEPNTLLYFFTEDPNEKSKWTLREVHKDASTMLFHHARVKDILGPWVECMVDDKWDDFTMVGDISEAAKEACKSAHEP
jgi:quinol monooxygenase YgiN